MHARCSWMAVTAMRLPRERTVRHMQYSNRPNACGPESCCHAAAACHGRSQPRCPGISNSGPAAGSPWQGTMVAAIRGRGAKGRSSHKEVIHHADLFPRHDAELLHWQGHRLQADQHPPAALPTRSGGVQGTVHYCVLLALQQAQMGPALAMHWDISAWKTCMRVPITCVLSCWRSIIVARPL